MEAIKEKICGYIFDRNYQNNIKEMPNKGFHDVEIDYKLAETQQVPDKIFVTYKKLRYYNGSLKERKTEVLTFDKKTGEHLPNYKWIDYINLNDLKTINDIC